LTTNIGGSFQPTAQSFKQLDGNESLPGVEGLSDYSTTAAAQQDVAATMAGSHQDHRSRSRTCLRFNGPEKLTAPTNSKLERQLQLIVAMPVEQFAYGVADEPGEGNTVFLCQRRQLLVVPLVDADGNPCRQLFPAPGSHRSSSPPKHCITVVNGAAMYCEAMSVVNRRVSDS
jgi:hypothetical protein